MRKENVKIGLTGGERMICPFWGFPFSVMGSPDVNPLLSVSGFSSSGCSSFCKKKDSQQDILSKTTGFFTFEAEAWLLSRGLIRQPKAMQLRTRQAVIRIAYSHPSAVINLKSCDQNWKLSSQSCDQPEKLWSELKTFITELWSAWKAVIKIDNCNHRAVILKMITFVFVNPKFYSMIYVDQQRLNRKFSLFC